MQVLILYETVKIYSKKRLSTKHYQTYTISDQVNSLNENYLKYFPTSFLHEKFASVRN
jgi:hypothetical protein